MSRYKLTIEYNGAPYCGWQRQADAPSIQQALEEAAGKLTQETITVHGAGRTDAGVHALGQVAHLDIEKPLTAFKVRDALNYHLRPHPISVLLAEETDETFHARFSARARHYVYRIVDRRADLTFDRKLAWRAPQRLDVDAMHEAAQALVGLHDFSTFRDALCQAKTPVKTLSAISVARDGQEVRVRVSAPSFLHRQVRSITGSLMEVGRGRRPVGYIADILKAADRAACGPVAPPDGLYLERVVYDAPDESPAQES